MPLKTIPAGGPGEPATDEARLPRQRQPEAVPGEPDPGWLRGMAVYRSVSRLRVQLLCHGLLDAEDDPLAGQLADLEARLTTMQPCRWESMLPALLAEEAGWWHSAEPQRPDPACRVCWRLRAGLTAEQLVTIPVPVTMTAA